MNTCVKVFVKKTTLSSAKVPVAKVQEFQDQMFYKVLAYKNYRGDVDNVIQAALANPDAKISLTELKAALHSYNVGGAK